MCRKLACLIIFALVVMAAPVGADTLIGLADVTVVDGAIVSLRYAETEYVVADGGLVLGTTTRWYIPADTGIPTLWAEGDPAPADTVSGTSNAKEGDVGSKADNFLFSLDGVNNISSIDGIDYQETIFAVPSDAFFLFERGGNDKGKWQAILADGSLGAEVAFDKTADGGPYADTSVSASGQNAYGVVFTTDVPVQGVRITASGHDTLSISTPAASEPEPTIVVEAGGDIAAANAIAVAGDIIGIAAGTYAITEAIEVKDGVTYLGAGSGQAIIDCGGVTRAFVGWGDRSQGDDLPYSETGYPVNTSGPKDWVIQGLSIINGVADNVDKSVLRVGDPAIDPPLAANVITDPLKSTNGGGICLENYAEGTVIDVAFENCNALATGLDNSDPNTPDVPTFLGFGGALYMGWATANVVDCSFTNNNSSNDGGAIHSSNPDPENWDLKIENSIFTKNRCRDDGGSISAIRRNLSLINCVIEDSKTGLDPNTLADNVSGDPDGGFLWISGAGKVADTSYAEDTPALEMLRYGGVVNIVGSTFNNCGSRRGGAIRSNSAAQFNVTDSVFTNCTTTDNDGGAIYANSPTPFNPAAVDVNDPTVGEPGVYLDGVTFDGCIAGDDGGAIAVDNFSTTNSANYIEYPKVVMNNCVVKNCRAGATVPDDGDRDGGGIYVNNQLDVTITNTVVENCTAGRNGAGIMVDGVCNSVLIDSVRISSCSNDDISGEGGDGVALNMDQDETAVVIVTNCIFDNNINIQDDAVVRIDGDIINVANCTFVGNTTTDKGILYFGTGRADPAIVTNKAVNNLFVNNDSSPGSDNTINWSKSENNNITMNNAFFGTILDNDSEIKGIADADLGLNGNFIASADPLADTAGGDYHLAAGSEAIDAGTAEDAPDHDIDGTARPQGPANDVGAYESPAN